LKLLEGVIPTEEAGFGRPWHIFMKGTEHRGTMFLRVLKKKEEGEFFLFCA
jgi:hypothetical protein